MIQLLFKHIYQIIYEFSTIFQCPVVRIVGDSAFQSRDEIYKVNIVNSLHSVYKCDIYIYVYKEGDDDIYFISIY